MRVVVLASGSGGNATFVEAGGVRVLVDAGCAPRTVRRRLASTLGSVPERLDAVIVTHAHGDHCRHAEALARSFGAPLRCTAETARARRLEGAEVFEAGESFAVGRLRVRSLSIPHDSPQVSLVLDDGHERLGLATDLGAVPEGLARHLAGCSTLLLESNHDPDMLARGPYDPLLKARVRSDRGHLSNQQAARLLETLADGLGTVVLMHLSETNNRPELAVAAAAGALSGRPTRLLAAGQSSPLAFRTTSPRQGLGSPDEGA